MSLTKGLQRRPSLVITTILACVVVAVAIWQTTRFAATASSGDKQNLQKQLRNGIGSEVRFASKAEQADDAVASAADFIYWRSGLKLSDDMKKKLAKAEKDVLNGKSHYITVTELTDTMTTVVIDRLATITDEEIQEVADASSDANSEIRSRADEKWGVLSKKDLIQQAQAGRERSRRQDVGLQTGLHSMIESEVNNSVSTLSTMLPEQFGNASSQGVTPTQALVIVYSVTTDDPLTNSRSDMVEKLRQKRMEERQTREQWKAQKLSVRPYGPHGFLHPSAPQLFFNKTALDSLINLSKGGKN